MVTTITLVPGHPTLLVSGSADGTIRTWRHLEGKQLHVENIPGCEAGEQALCIISHLASSPVNGDIAVMAEGCVSTKPIMCRNSVLRQALSAAVDA